jgi:hypothetical protein
LFTRVGRREREGRYYFTLAYYRKAKKMEKKGGKGAEK